MNDWQPLARALAGGLDVGDERWRKAFAEVPRHLFVPRFYRRDDHSPVSGEQADQLGEWLDAVYSDESLTTQLASVPGTDLRWPTSSSSLPSLMARMLDLLDVADASDVLEIGTGTGYNAALLCHRLGDRHVTSVDLDPELVAVAAKRIGLLGWSPYLTAGDGADGVPDRAPYDRLIATCSIADVPASWLEQLRPGARIVGEVRGELVDTGSLVVLHVDRNQTASGRFLGGRPGYFMWLRAQVDNPLRDGGEYASAIDHTNTTEDTTSIDPRVLNDRDFRFLLQRRQPTLSAIWTADEDEGSSTILLWADGAWVEVGTTALPNGRFRVTERTDQPAWHTVENAYDLWRGLGQPDRTRYGLTATPTEQWTWLDNQDHRVA